MQSFHTCTVNSRLSKEKHQTSHQWDLLVFASEKQTNKKTEIDETAIAVSLGKKKGKHHIDDSFVCICFKKKERKKKQKTARKINVNSKCMHRTFAKLLFSLTVPEVAHEMDCLYREGWLHTAIWKVCTTKWRLLTKRRITNRGAFIIIIINPLTARVVGAPQVILQPVFSIFPCSPLPSGTCRTPGLSIP